MNLLKEISKDRLIVVVSHNKNDAYKYGDRIIEMSNGQIKSYKYRNENYFNEYVSSENEIALPAKGRLSKEQLQEVNQRIKSLEEEIKKLEASIARRQNLLSNDEVVNFSFIVDGAADLVSIVNSSSVSKKDFEVYEEVDYEEFIVKYMSDVMYTLVISGNL